MNQTAFPKVMTGVSLDFPVPEELRNILCYLDDGRLLISKSHATNPHVRAFISRLLRLGRHCEVMQVDLAVIDAVYQGNSSISLQRSDSEMQRAAKLMFERAVEMRASDIHLRVTKRERTRVFFRVHNDLQFIEEHPYEYGDQLCATIYQAMADVADATFEPLSRQDARISDRSKVPTNLDGVRIATTPQVDGHLMVLRLLYNDASDRTDLSELGYHPLQCDALALMKRRPTGINILGGPTGSGKSTTLQRVLGSIIKECQGRKHVITVEDPPEYPIPGAVQTPVTNAESEEERSRAFQRAIKAAMRLDPDVIMIGEVRDAPSAKLAVQAAMTGHQVWTTVHANGAFSILDRLIDLGVPVQLATDPTIITGLCCQRLLKVLCPDCRIPISDAAGRYEPEDIARITALIPAEQVYVRGEGCPRCRQSGTTGRTVVAETVVTDEKLMHFLRSGEKTAAVTYWQRQQDGMLMVDHAISKVKSGLVDPFQAEDIVGPLDMRPGQEIRTAAPAVEVTHGR